MHSVKNGTSKSSLIQYFFPLIATIALTKCEDSKKIQKKNIALKRKICQGF